jgi:TonB-linked SusC/RagA family outer membrane protein
VKAEDIEKQPVNNPLYALQGRIAGLQVTPSTGLAGAPVRLQIRGRNSLLFETEPLVVIDGLPVANNITGLGHDGYVSNQFSYLSFINPNEIESMEILKDADATSIYGSRGANGVILITTKKGKSGSSKIDINMQTGWADVSNMMNMVSLTQYLDIRKEAFSNNNLNLSALPINRSNVDVKFWNPNRYTNWQKVLIGKTSRYTDVQGQISGGSVGIQYLIGANYHKETTVFPGNSADQKGSTHISLTGVSPNAKFKATVTTSYMMDKNTLPQVDFTQTAIILPPNAPAPFNADGSLNWEPLPSGEISWNNPYALLYRTYQSDIKNILLSADISYRIHPSITLKTQIGYNDLNGNAFNKNYPFTGRPPQEINSDGYATFTSNNSKGMSIEPQIQYSTTISKGNLNVLLGSSIQNTKSESQNIFAYGFKSDGLMKNLSSAISYNLNNTTLQYKYAAVFGRLNYNLDNKFIVNLNIRRDGSSRFGPGNQFGNFGSIGAAWIFSEDPFTKSVLPFISFGKLRFSYGTSGNDAIQDYGYFERYQSINVNDPYLGTRGYSTLGLFNSSYAWETTRKIELSLETGLFKDKIFLTTSYFRNRSDNQLQSYPYPSSSGPGSALVNIPALVQNMGIELTLNTENIKTSSFKWSTSINFTRNRNKLISYPDIQSSAYYRSIIGQPFYGQSLAFNSAGVDPQTGMYQFKTIDGKIVSDPEDISRQDGGQYLHIFTEPKFYGGITNTFTYKRISLDVFFQFNKQTVLTPYDPFLRVAGGFRNLPAEFSSRWKKTGDVTNIQKVFITRPFEYESAINRLIQSNSYYVDGSFIRLKNFSLSYSISTRAIQKMRIQNLRVYAQGQNLWTVTKYKGLDPETKSLSLPPLRVVTMGINVTF